MSKPKTAKLRVSECCNAQVMPKPDMFGGTEFRCCACGNVAEDTLLVEVEICQTTT
jgi:hypothetical protein